jgi:hypothetical protein
MHETSFKSSSSKFELGKCQEVDVVALQYDSGFIPESKTVDSGLFTLCELK